MRILLIYLCDNKLIYCELIDPYYYHLDTCFCPLNEELAILYPAAFGKETQKTILANIKTLPVTQEEAKLFACNAVVIDKHGMGANSVSGIFVTST